MVAHRAHTRLDKRFVHFLDVFARVAIHHARIIGVRLGIHHDTRKLFARLKPLDAEMQVWTIEPRDNLIGVLKAQQSHDIGAHAFSCRSGKSRHGRAFGKLLDELPDA